VEVEKVRKEEVELEKRFPEFTDYKKMVGFLIPRG
jgi:protein-S-isoprenylcysteine O-methyltransferase Ste14